MNRFFSFTCHRISLFPVPAYKWQPRPRMVKILTGEWWNVCKENFNPFLFVFLLLFQLADRLLMNCLTLWLPKEKSWDSLVQFASISARKEVMYQEGLFISALTKCNPKKVPRLIRRNGSRKIYRRWSCLKRNLHLLSWNFVGLTLFYERISVSFLMMDFLSISPDLSRPYFAIYFWFNFTPLFKELIKFNLFFDNNYMVFITDRGFWKLTVFRRLAPAVFCKL